MMFFRSVCAVFSGVSAFPELAKRNTFRALFHLLLFCLILAFICGGIQTYFAGKKISACAAGLEKQFRSIVVSEKGILPEQSAETPRTFYLPGNCRLDYLPGESIPFVREMTGWKQHFGFFWMRCGVLFWARPDPSKDVCYLGTLPIPNAMTAVQMMPGQVPQMIFQPLTPAGVEAVLKKYDAMPHIKKGELNGKYSFTALADSFRKYLYSVLVLSLTFGKFFLTLLLILMFAGMQALWRAPGLETLGFGGTVALLSYASFPAVAVEMILESFAFHGLAEILFFVLFFIYQLMAFNEVRRSISGGPDPNDRQS